MLVSKIENPGFELGLTNRPDVVCCIAQSSQPASERSRRLSESIKYKSRLFLVPQYTAKPVRTREMKSLGSTTAWKRIGRLLLWCCIILNGCRGDELMDKEDIYEGRIIGGDSASRREFPFYVRLERPGGVLHCGGSLIAAEWVLTAAHCNTTQLVAKVGAYSVSEPPLHTSAISQVFIHHEYKNRIHYDYMLLRLERPAPVDVQPVRLNTDTDRPAAGTPLITMGMGTTEVDTYSPSPTLLKVEINAVGHRNCNALFRQAGHIIDKTSMLCAGLYGGGRDSCVGDSGGPLVDVNNVQVGIVSWGLGCGHHTYPGVYSRVSGAMTWIELTLCQNPTPHAFVAVPDICPQPPQTAVAPPGHQRQRPHRNHLRQNLRRDDNAMGQPTSCVDAPPTRKYFMTADTGRRTCAWLAFQEEEFQRSVCAENAEVYEQCPVTCERCRDRCEDDLNAIFEAWGGVQDCRWLAMKRKRQLNFCKPDKVPYRVCRETCDSCTG